VSETLSFQPGAHQNVSGWLCKPVKHAGLSSVCDLLWFKL
jgi:hypothetical protein